MSGFLIAEEGTLTGLVLPLEGAEEWIIGRDPDAASLILEDPMVSRKHLLVRLVPMGVEVENMSTVNPAHLNGKTIEEPTLLQEGDTLQVGGTFFRFSEVSPHDEVSPLATHKMPSPIQEEPLARFSFSGGVETRFVIKVISGPNTGAEFGMEPGTSYLLGKDPETCDIVFQDLSVSREHARLSIDNEGVMTIEDLNSRNGVLINGKPIGEIRTLTPQDLIALGTTTFLIIDRSQTRETIFSPPTALIHPTDETTEEEEEEKKRSLEEADRMARKSWKEMIIPMRHLILAGLFVVLLFVGFSSILSLFKTKPVEIVKRDESGEIYKVVENYPTIEFTYTPSSGKLFLVGHVLTDVDHEELIYLLQALPFVMSIEDNVVIDELVWQDVNALLMKNPDWRGVTLTGPEPGRFLLRGYIADTDAANSLFDWMNRNFNYINLLESKVVVVNTLEIEIQSLLVEKGFGTVTFQFNSGELLLSGSINQKAEKSFGKTLTELKNLNGVRQIKNFVILSTAETAHINLSSKYQVSGSSSYDGMSQYVVIDGKILSQGDTLDGMIITSINANTVFLEKDGLKFKINYNQQ